MSNIKVEIRNMTKKFEEKGHREIMVLDNISVQIEEGKFVSILGPSGCGKSTLLNIICGIMKPTAGEILIDGKPLNMDAENNIKLGYVFQTPRLLEWLTLEENIHFVLEAQNIPKRNWQAITQRYVRMTGLSGYEKNLPRQLSGGMQQRASIARALAIEPDVMLMDEPFSHLDEITARKLRRELISIWQAAGKMSIVFVTHDMTESVFLSNVIYLLTSKPCKVFMCTEVDLPMPRDPEDAKLFELERRLLKEFYANAEPRMTEKNSFPLASISSTLLYFCSFKWIICPILL